jgi:muramoyltetrapeptide carboxypeptidase LdcA involved in peptidoglycan recycling
MGVPVLGNADFGHTNPLATIPIGGRITVTAGPTNAMTITAH